MLIENCLIFSPIINILGLRIIKLLVFRKVNLYMSCQHKVTTAIFTKNWPAIQHFNSPVGTNPLFFITVLYILKGCS